MSEGIDPTPDGMAAQLVAMSRATRDRLFLTRQIEYFSREVSDCRHCRDATCGGCLACLAVLVALEREAATLPEPPHEAAEAARSAARAHRTSDALRYETLVGEASVRHENARRVA